MEKLVTEKKMINWYSLLILIVQIWNTTVFTVYIMGSSRDLFKDVIKVTYFLLRKIQKIKNQFLVPAYLLLFSNIIEECKVYSTWVNYWTLFVLISMESLV